MSNPTETDLYNSDSQRRRYLSNLGVLPSSSPQQRPERASSPTFESLSESTRAASNSPILRSLIPPEQQNPLLAAPSVLLSQNAKAVCPCCLTKKLCNKYRCQHCIESMIQEQHELMDSVRGETTHLFKRVERIMIAKDRADTKANRAAMQTQLQNVERLQKIRDDRRLRNDKLREQIEGLRKNNLTRRNDLTIARETLEGLCTQRFKELKRLADEDRQRSIQKKDNLRDKRVRETTRLYELFQVNESKDRALITPHTLPRRLTVEELRNFVYNEHLDDQQRLAYAKGSCAAIGNVAHLCLILAKLYQTDLPYPIQFQSSRSYVRERVSSLNVSHSPRKMGHYGTPRATSLPLDARPKRASSVSDLHNEPDERSTRKSKRHPPRQRANTTIEKPHGGRSSNQRQRQIPVHSQRIQRDTHPSSTHSRSSQSKHRSHDGKATSVPVPTERKKSHATEISREKRQEKHHKSRRPKRVVDDLSKLVLENEFRSFPLFWKHEEAQMDDLRFGRGLHLLDRNIQFLCDQAGVPERYLKKYEMIPNLLSLTKIRELLPRPIELSSHEEQSINASKKIGFSTRDSQVMFESLEDDLKERDETRSDEEVSGGSASKQEYGGDDDSESDGWEVIVPSE